MKIKYLYRKGRIVTITWRHGGQICKVLARPGQIVYDPITEKPYTLSAGKYVVYYNELRINHEDYMATLYNGMCTLFPGILVDEIHLVASTAYEKILRRKGITISPNYNSEEPQGNKDEVIVFKTALLCKVKPRIVTILNIDFTDDSPVFELSNGDYVNRGTLKSLYRKPTLYEKKSYFRKMAKVINSFTEYKKRHDQQVCFTT